MSLTAGREKEGPYPTRLYTRTDKVAHLPAVQPGDPAQGYTPEEAIREAGRCLQCQCLECVKVCAYLEHFGGYPKKYAREIYNNASIVIGSRQANKLINSCSLCGLCEAVCPEDFAMQTLCLEARKDMVQNGKMPPSAHEFALLDMAFSNGAQFAMARHEPGKGSQRGRLFPRVPAQRVFSENGETGVCPSSTGSFRRRRPHAGMLQCPGVLGRADGSISGGIFKASGTVGCPGKAGDHPGLFHLLPDIKDPSAGSEHHVAVAGPGGKGPAGRSFREGWPAPGGP